MPMTMVYGSQSAIKKASNFDRNGLMKRSHFVIQTIPAGLIGGQF
jgi:hypothetical protein